jgi:hypothetical protein
MPILVYCCAFALIHDVDLHNIVRQEDAITYRRDELIAGLCYLSIVQSRKL